MWRFMIVDSSCISQPWSSSGNFYGSEIRHGIFGGLNFGPGIFWRFVWDPSDFFGFWFLPPFDHPCHLKSGVPTLGHKYIDKRRICWQEIGSKYKHKIKEKKTFLFFFSFNLYSMGHPWTFLDSMHFIKVFLYWGWSPGGGGYCHIRAI